jgi:conserved oligomeric Golgi complex subunit 6
MTSSYFTEGKTGGSLDALLPPTPATPGARPSALSSRITSVLSASYSDLEIRDALGILDNRGFKNTSESRRRLRLDIQEEVIQRNGEVLKDFKGLADELKGIDAILSSLSKCCGEMRTHVQSANLTTAPVLEEANGLLLQKQAVHTKQHILTAFQSHFLLSDLEIATLTSSSDPLDDSFFATLTKLKRVHADSQFLLSSANERLGLDILEQSSRTLTSAYQKLFRWTQREFRNLDLENPRISAGIRRALRVLAERPSLFASCLDYFAESREETLSDSFHAALTGSGDDIVGKPIEFHAHDPLRYISDMLAWVHSATVSEREALEVLFIGEGEELAKGIKAGIDNDIWTRQGTNDENEEASFDGRKALNDLVSRDIAGIARLLRQRTEQVIQGQEEAAAAYRIANLLAFYKITFQKLLGPAAEILQTLSALETSAKRQFRANMNDHVLLMQPELAQPPSTDGAPPDFLADALETLKTLLRSYDTSLAGVASSADDNDDGDSGFTPVFKEALDPFLQGCETQWTELDPPVQHILAINCLFAIQNTLSPYDFARKRMQDTASRIEAHATALEQHQHAFLLAASGLQPLVTALATTASSDIARLALLPELQPKPLLAASHALDAFLPSALMDARDHVGALQSTRLARDVTERAAERFCADFEMVEGVVLAVDGATAGRAGREEGGSGSDSDDEEMPSLRELFPRTSGEIRVLLS